MIALTVALWVPILFAGLPKSQQDGVLYSSPDGSVVISGVKNVTEFSLDPETGENSVGGDGSPVHGIIKASGLDLTTNSFDGTIRSTKTTHYLTKAHTRGQTVIVLDSAVAAKFRPSEKSAGQGTYRFEIDTDQSDYAGKEAEGELNLPTPLDVTGHLEGKRDVLHNKKTERHTSVQDLKIHAVSGSLNIDPRPGAGIGSIRNGEFEGPITFHTERTDTNLDDRSVSVFRLETGGCDRLRISTDPEGETMTLEGNVHFDMETDFGTSHISQVDSFVFRFSPDMTLLRAKAAGTPFEMTVPLKPKTR